MDISNSNPYDNEPNNTQHNSNTQPTFTQNHIIEENHVILAEQILEYYKTNTSLNFYKYALPSTNDFSKYFLKI